MRVLFDQGTPVPLRKFLQSHQVETAFERGWASLKNGELLNEAERYGFEIFITTDQNLRFQQKLVGRKLAVIILSSTSWPRIQKIGDAIAQAVNTALPGSVQELIVPQLCC